MAAQQLQRGCGPWKRRGVPCRQQPPMEPGTANSTLPIAPATDNCACLLAAHLVQTSPHLLQELGAGRLVRPRHQLAVLGRHLAHVELNREARLNAFSFSYV